MRLRAPWWRRRTPPPFLCRETLDQRRWCSALVVVRNSTGNQFFSATNDNHAKRPTSACLNGCPLCVCLMMIELSHSMEYPRAHCEQWHIHKILNTHTVHVLHTHCTRTVCLYVSVFSLFVSVSPPLSLFLCLSLSVDWWYRDGDCARLLRLPDFRSGHIVVSSFVYALSDLRLIRVAASLAQVKQ